MGIGSGGNYALAAARALIDGPLEAEAIVRKAMDIAADKPDLPNPTTSTRLFFKSIMPSHSHRSFSVVNANSANTSARIQNRAITFDVRQARPCSVLSR